jgi:hypothetical protein
MIASDADLKEVIEQFKNKGSVKVFASVETFAGQTNVKAPSRESAAAESSTQTVHSAADSTTQTATTTQSSSATQTAPTTTRPTTCSSASASPSASTSNRSASSSSAHANATAFRRSHHKAPNHLHEVVESFVNAVATAVITVADQIQPPPVTPSATPSATATQANHTTTTPAPFIHGRHTCDGCLTTPIVGTRYLAINLPDYDLCAQCKDNYKGSEIKFQAVVLDRDRPFQERWQRRQAHMNATRNATSGSGNGERSRSSRHTTGYAHARNPRNARVHGHGPNRVNRRCGHGGADGIEVSPVKAGQQDLAVAEAIRRSLEDVKKSQDAVAQTCKTAVVYGESDKALTHHAESLDEAIREHAKARAVSETTEETASDEAGNSEEEENDDDSVPGLSPPGGGVSHAPKVSPVKTTKSTFPEVRLMDTLSFAEFQVHTPKILPANYTVEIVRVEDQLKLAVEGEQKSDDETTDSMPDLLARAGVVGVTNEEESDIDSDDDETDDSMPQLFPRVSPVNYTVPKEVDIVMKTETDTSFASDAEGSGEIAAVLGETLDRVAQAIDDLNLDLDRTPSEEQKEKEIVVEATVKDRKDVDVDEISQPAEDDDCDSWNMVADDDN